GPVISLISPNDVDFGTVIWAAHKLGCTVAPSNAGATAEELIHQLRLSGATFVIAHPASLSRALSAAAACGIPPQRVVILSRQTSSVHRSSCRTIEQIICLGRDASARGASVDPQHDDNASPRAAFLCFSSGTTGLPKAVVVPHRALIADILLTAATSIPATRHYAPGSDSVLGVIPMSHMYGLLTLVHLYPYLGITSTLYETLPPFEEFLDSVERLHIEHLLVVPPLINAFLKHPKGAGRTYPFFKSCLVAAAPLDEEREKQFRALGGPDFHLSQVFGMTETGASNTVHIYETFSHFHSWPNYRSVIRQRSGRVCGRLLPCVTAKIVDGDGRIVPIGSPGELLVKGPQVCLGYLDNPAATGEALDNEGFLRTGDLVIVNEHGDIFVKERLKQIIKSKGFQVSPAELEGHILGHPFVQDVGVIGRPDERAGEVPVAFITLSAAGRQAAATSVSRVEEDVKLFVKEHKSTYKWLGDVFIVEEIPKLPSGKILVRELKKL
ncbi:acetyl-CoA synthetase-like protein, partial [Exidia glandulosa HHB12029]